MPVDSDALDGAPVVAGALVEVLLTGAPIAPANALMSELTATSAPARS